MAMMSRCQRRDGEKKEAHCFAMCLSVNILLYLDYALCHHGFSYFHETGDVGAFDIIDISVGFCAVFDAVAVDVFHYEVQAMVNFLCRP